MANLADKSGDAYSNLVHGDGSNTLTFTMPGNVPLAVESVVATIDNAAGGDTSGTLTIRDQAGQVIATQRMGDSIPAGDTGTSTFALRLLANVAGGIRYVIRNVGGWLDVAATSKNPATGFPVRFDVSAKTNTTYPSTHAVSVGGVVAQAVDLTDAVSWTGISVDLENDDDGSTIDGYSLYIHGPPGGTIVGRQDEITVQGDTAAYGTKARYESKGDATSLTGSDLTLLALDASSVTGYFAQANVGDNGDATTFYGLANALATSTATGANIQASSEDGDAFGIVAIANANADGDATAAKFGADVSGTGLAIGLQVVDGYVLLNLPTVNAGPSGSLWSDPGDGHRVKVIP